MYYYTLFRITSHQEVNNKTISTKREKGVKLLNVTSLSVGVKDSSLSGESEAGGGNN